MRVVFFVELFNVYVSCPGVRGCFVDIVRLCDLSIVLFLFL